MAPKDDKDFAEVERLRKTPEVKALVKQLHELISGVKSQYDAPGQHSFQQEFHDHISMFQAVVVEGEIGDEVFSNNPFLQRLMANGMAMGFMLGKKQN
jgi:hypothetical protein